MIDEGQVRNIVKEVLKEEHLDDFIKIFEKEHNIFRGSHDKINLPENLEIPEKIIKYIVESKYIYEKIIQVGAFEFIDNFADASQFWAWRKYLGATPANKSGTEAGGKYTLGVNNGINGEWDGGQSESPRLFIGILSYPCEVITKLDTFTATLNTSAGLFIAKDPIGFGSDLYFAIEQRVAATENGVCVTRDGSVLLAYDAVPTLPMWFRLRIGCTSYRGLNVYFDYSVDGKSWINLHEENTSITLFSLNPAAVGIYASNYGTHAPVTASFDHFLMRLKSIN